MKCCIPSLILALTMAIAARAEPPMIAYSPPPLSNWSYLSDQVMGGVSQGTVRIEGVAQDAYLHLTGDVSTKNRGGFIQTRTDLAAPFPADAIGIVLRVRGNDQRYYVHLRTRGTILPWQFYQAGFEAGPDWSTVHIPFDAFQPKGRLLRAKLDPGSVNSLGVAAYGRAHRADLSARWIGLY